MYIVRCADGTLYTGYARDPEARVAAHNNGRGAKYTSGRRPVTLIHTEPFRSKRQALRRELQIKKLSRHQKAAMVRDALKGVADPDNSSSKATRLFSAYQQND